MHYSMKFESFLFILIDIIIYRLNCCFYDNYEASNFQGSKRSSSAKPRIVVTDDDDDETF